MTVPKALDGILVVSIEQAVAAPLATCRLADAGARVIKIERPGGDFARGYDKAANGYSSYFSWLNRGKESIVLDVKDESDSSLLEAILGKTDVFVQNLSVGAAERAGFGSTRLRATYPRIVTCDISGYGEEGPYRDMRAYDLLVQAESGLVSVNGAPDQMCRVGVSVCDISAGLNAALAIQQALFKRARTGVGESLKVSLFDSIADWMTVPYLHQVYLDAAPARVGLAHPSIAPYGAFKTSEGDLVLIAIQNEREWRRLAADVLDKPEWLDDERLASNTARVEHRDIVDEAVQRAVGALRKEEVIRRLDAARIAFGEIRDVGALAKHPQLRTLDLQFGDSIVRYPAPPARGDDYVGFGSIPVLDEHGSAIRSEFSGLLRGGSR